MLEDFSNGNVFIFRVSPRGFTPLKCYSLAMGDDRCRNS